MTENNTTPEPFKQSTASEMYVAELEAKVAELTRSLEYVKASRDGYLDLNNKVRSFIQASLDREEWTQEELSEQYWEELAELLDLSLPLERQITVTVTWNLTVKGSKQSLDAYDFEATLEPANGQFEIISGDGWPDIDVNE